MVGELIMSFGDYVSYGDNTYLIVGGTGSLLQLNSLKHGRVQVSAKNVIYKGNRYIVTLKNNIFSVATGRLMAWPVNHGCRLGILSLAFQFRKEEKTDGARYLFAAEEHKER